MTTTAQAIDLNTASVVEIDTELNRLMHQQSIAKQRFDQAVLYVHETAGTVTGYGRRRSYTATLDQALLRLDREQFGHGRALDLYTEAYDKLAEVTAGIEAIDAEFQARGGWTRAFLVANAGGHLHRDMYCSTCYPSTTYYLFAELSGHDEAEIVAKAGSDACTVCYPSAPVNDLKRPRSIFTQDEQAAQQAREAKAQARAERETKRLAKALMPGGEPLVFGDGYLDTLTTLSGARTWLTDSVTWNRSSRVQHGQDHPSYTQDRVTLVAQAVAAKEGKDVETVLAEAVKRADRRR